MRRQNCGKASLLLMILALLGWAISPVSAAAPYTVTDLGTLSGLSGSGSSAYRINGSGQVVGGSDAASGYDAFLWKSGSGMTALNTFGGSYSYAYGINDSGKVVGAAYTTGWVDRAFLWKSGSTTMDLGTLKSDNSGKSEAYDINSSDQVVGWADASGSKRAFLWENGSMADLGTLTGGTKSYAYGINDSGQVVGKADVDASGTNHAFLWESGPAGMTDLGTLGGPESYAYSINDSGQVVGRADTATVGHPQHAFLWESGPSGMTDLGTLSGDSSSNAYGINNFGQVVGYSGTASEHAFLYDSTNGMQDLNNLIDNPNWDLLRAYDINNTGQIVGKGSINGETHAFLLSTSTPIPEPGTLSLLAMGVIWGLGFRRRHRKR